MKMQIEHSNKKKTSAQKVFYSSHPTSIHNYRQILQIYFKDLTFNQAINEFRELDLQEIQKLKQICDQLYFRYEEGELTLLEVQGLWPLLTFFIPNINGLQIYLYFQYLMTPVQTKHLNLQVKQQEPEFNPQGFFQNSRWFYKKKFVQSLRLLQRKLSKRSQEQNIKACLKLLQLISMDNYEYISVGKDFNDSYQRFKMKITKQNESRRMLQQSSISPIFGTRLFQQQQILSEPDMMHNVLKAFTKEEYKHHHQTNTMIQFYRPIQEQPQQSNSQSSYQQTITVNLKKTSAGLTKRRLKTSTNNDTPVRKYLKAKPIKRNKIVERFFELDIKKNTILEEIKKNKRREEKQKRKKRRLQKIQNQINYLSEDEEEYKQKRKRYQRKPKNRMQAQSEPQIRRNSSNRRIHQQLFINDSEEQEIVMKRKRLCKKPIHDFDHKSSSQSEQDQVFYHKPNKNRMVVEEQQYIVDKKRQEFCMGKIQSHPQQIDNKIMQKIGNIQIRKLHLNQGAYGLMNEFEFAPYRKRLSCFQRKQIKKQIQIVVKQTIARENIPFDIDLTLKIVAIWEFVQCFKQSGKQQMAIYIKPLLKYIIGVNLYRCNSEIFNNLFDWANNTHVNQLKRAYAYFSTVFEVARNFISIGLQNQIMDIFYNSMITPKKYEKLKKNQTFFSQSACINLKNPFRIGQKNLKFRLDSNQQQIGFFVSSLIQQIVILWRFVDKSSEAFKIRQKKFIKIIQTELTQLSNKQNPIWFYNLTNTIKHFYSTYKPYLSKEYFLLIANVLNASLQKLVLQSITTEDQYQSNSQIEFLVLLVTDYAQIKQRQLFKPPQILNEIILQTNFKQNYGSKRNNATSTMIYSSILLSLIRIPFFKIDLICSNFLKYLQESIFPDISNIILSLKSKIYEPVFELIKEIYQFQVDKKFKQFNSNDDNVTHQDITKIINNLWDCLNQKYEVYDKLLKQRLRSRSSNSNTQPRIDYEKQICQIRQKLSQSSKSLYLFLKLFIVNNFQLNSPLSLSASHYFFRLKFSVEYNYFVKYLCNNDYSNLTQCILQNIFLLLQGARKNHRKYTDIIINGFNNAFKHKQIQYHILQQNTNPSIQQAISVINAVNLISAAQHSKQRFTAPPENSVMKFVKQSVEGFSIEGIKYQNIEQSVNCFNFFLAKLQSYLKEKQAYNSEIIRVKAFIWQHLIGRWMKQIVQLICLGGVVLNNIENKSIPLKQMVNRLVKLYAITQDHNSLKIQKDLGYTVFLFCLQQIQSYDSVSDVLSEMSRYRKSRGFSQMLEKGISQLLLDIYYAFKKNQKYQRVKSPITIQSIRILTFLLQWPEIIAEPIKNFLKEMQVLSNGISLITQIRINQINMAILLNFFEKIEISKTKVFRINQAMHIFISKVTQVPIVQPLRQNHFKNVRRILTSVRDCLMKDVRLKSIGLIFIKQFVKHFCSPQKLEERKQTSLSTLQVYLEMMKNSMLQRSAYQYLIVQNRRRFQLLIPRLMAQVQKQNSHLYSTLQSVILTCMIGGYSDFYDIKRLIGAIKKDSLLSSSKKKGITALLQKLKKNAIESGGCNEIVIWCNNQMFEIAHADNIQDWMDIE